MTKLRNKLIRLAHSTEDEELKADLLGILKAGSGKPPEEYAPRMWFRSMDAITEACAKVGYAIDEYGDAMRDIRKMDVPKEVEKLAIRGDKTARERERDWTGIQNDVHLMNRSFVEAIEKGWKPRHMK
jgi:hypothetical protein